MLRCREEGGLRRDGSCNMWIHESLWPGVSELRSEGRLMSRMSMTSLQFILQALPESVWRGQWMYRLILFIEVFVQTIFGFPVWVT